MGLGCNWFTQVRGTNPQSGQQVDEWSCAITWLPMLLINATQEVRQGAAAAESFRNEVVAATETSRSIAIQLASKVVQTAISQTQKLIEG
ncbi:MAG: hypothetical protein Q7R66_18565 [Undibacterium sp.]|nr:hypothetical protein [Undibacterium sp.]